MQFSAFCTFLLLFSTVLINSFLAAGAKSSANKKAPACNTAAFEKCIDRQLMIGDEKFVWPTNMKQMNARCKDTKRLQACSADFIASCLDGETKNNMKLIMYGVTKSNRAYCSSTDRKSAHIRVGRCANRNKARMLAAVRGLNRQWHGIPLYPEARQRIPMICCSYSAFKQVALAALSDCTTAEQATFEALMDSYAADGLSLMCGGYSVEESDVCGPILERIPKWEGPFRRKVFFLAAVDVLNSL